MGCGRAAFNSLFRRPTVLYRQSASPLRIGIERRARCPTGPSARAISGYSQWLAAKFGAGQALPGSISPLEQLPDCNGHWEATRSLISTSRNDPTRALRTMAQARNVLARNAKAMTTRKQKAGTSMAHRIEPLASDV